MASAAMKMDELLVSWLSSDEVYEKVLEWAEHYRAEAAAAATVANNKNNNNNATPTTNNSNNQAENDMVDADDNESHKSPTSAVIPPFYPKSPSSSSSSNSSKLRHHHHRRRRSRTPLKPYETWEPLSQTEQQQLHALSSFGETGISETGSFQMKAQQQQQQQQQQAEECARDQARVVFMELGQNDPPLTTSPSSVNSRDKSTTTTTNTASSTSKEDSELSLLYRKYLTPEAFVRITKEVCRFPSFFNLPLYQRILDLWNAEHTDESPMEVITYKMLEWFWKEEMDPYDAQDRFYRLVKQPEHEYILRDDFLPFIKALLNDHPGLEFLQSHAEFQEKYAVTVITRIFYSVNRCHTGRITSRQIRRSDLLEAFQQVDEEEDINNVTRYFSYEHFYVLYCRFWELDHDRDYRITREDLLKYGDHSLSHMIVDRIFDAAPRPFHPLRPNREYLSYEDFIYFMLSEEDKSNEVSVRYWFTCVDVDGDGKLNNMEMRSFYAVQLHRMQCMGHEIVPFEDMLCQMMDMIKPASEEYLVPEDFLQPECCQVSGALFDALFNLNKYLMFEQRDPFVERQKREDEFECDWDRFACIDYKRLAMEEEAREEEAMEIDWVTVDDDEGHLAAEGFAEGGDVAGPGVNEAPF